MPAATATCSSRSSKPGIAAAGRPMPSWCACRPRGTTCSRRTRACSTRWSCSASRTCNPEIWREINVKGNRLDTPQAIEAFFTSRGVSKADFQKAFASFAIDSKIMKAEDLNRRYRITGTPTVVVNGKYVTDVEHGRRRRQAVRGDQRPGRKGKATGLIADDACGKAAWFAAAAFLSPAIEPASPVTRFGAFADCCGLCAKTSANLRFSDTSCFDSSSLPAAATPGSSIRRPRRSRTSSSGPTCSSPRRTKSAPSRRC